MRNIILSLSMFGLSAFGQITNIPTYVTTNSELQTEYEFYYIDSRMPESLWALIYNRNMDHLSTQVVQNATSDGDNIVAGYNIDETGITNSVILGYEAGYNASGDKNSYLGEISGLRASGNGNAYVGYASGIDSLGSGNLYLGRYSGDTSSGDANVYLGNESGYESSGDNNAYIGFSAGENSTGDKNIYAGYNAGSSSSSLEYSAYFGPYSGDNASGIRNTYVGLYAGRNAVSTNTLYIEQHFSGILAPEDSAFILDGDAGSLRLGRPSGTLYLRGTISDDIDMGGNNVLGAGNLYTDSEVDTLLSDKIDSTETTNVFLNGTNEVFRFITLTNGLLIQVNSPTGWVDQVTFTE